ncbi:hypothetical protein C804_05291, partial [Lachnospiraceae bacterium A4]
MFSEVVHKGGFRNPSLGRCPLVTDLARTNLPNKADRKAL